MNKSNGSSRVYHYYHFADGKRIHKENKIQQANISENQLWESFFAPIKELAISEELAALIADHPNQIGKSASGSVEEMKSKVRARLTQMGDKEVLTLEASNSQTIEESAKTLLEPEARWCKPLF